ncbi:gamma-glutamylcyclotransferase family protein [Chloroflexus sp.]|uniref:gamma-glutamylcyclotransferase family protein n=1 Tax=Chloroflexus sp. TaxID=1904827 RepID=UPI00298EE755|nr:gamma-glutamylcyclotransferase family protein [Chloroflexus sp.]MDW8404339.1 gamma-glutamylcyclotransferase family protein [Chloroflexus sp.]
MATRVLYFAYGSNMLSERLCSRVPSAQVIGRARLEDWRLVFNKRSRDGSAKANLTASLGDTTWGVLYEVDAQDLNKLDKIEGGYQRISVQICKPDGEKVTAATYVSTDVVDNQTAYEWYKNMVIAGAREHGLPQDYIAYLEGFPSQPSTTS